MVTGEKILDFIGDMGLLSENRTHMVTKITIFPFEEKICVDVITGMKDTDFQSYHVPVFTYEKEGVE